MPARRIFSDDIDEPVIWSEDGRLVGEETGTEYDADPGAIFETDDGREFEWQEAFEEPTPEFAYRQTLEAQREAAELHAERLLDDQERKEEADEEADERYWEAERRYTDAILRERADLAADEEDFKRRRRDYEREVRPITEAEAADWRDSGWPPLAAKSTTEQLTDAYEDAERERLGVSGSNVMTRDTAIAKAAATGNSQNYSWPTVREDPDGNRGLDLVEFVEDDAP